MGKYNKYLTKGYVQIIPHVPSYPWALPEMCQSLKCHPSHSKYHQRCHAMPFLQRIIGFIFVTKVVALKQRCHSWLWTVMSSDFIVCVCVCVCFSLLFRSLTLSASLFRGIVDTPLIHSESLRPLVQRWLSDIPAGRLAQVTDLQAAVVYLASDASDYMTGHNLVIEGGQSLW